MKFLIIAISAFAFLLLFGVAVAIFGILAFSSPEVATVLIVNNADSAIEDLNVEVSGFSFDVADMPSKSSVRIHFPVTKTSDYRLKVKLASGEEFGGQFGYVTTDLKSNDKIVVSGSDVRFD